MATQDHTRPRRRRRTARKGIAPIVAAAIIAAALIGGVTAYYLTRPAGEQPLTVVGTANLLVSVKVKYIAQATWGIGGEYLIISVVTNTSEPVDLYILKQDGDNYVVVHSRNDVTNDTLIKSPYTEGPLYVLAVYGGYVDAIVVYPPSSPGSMVVSTEHVADPTVLAQHVRVKVRWWDIIWEQWSGAWGLATALKFTGQVVAGMLPYAGSLWMLWFLGAVMKSLSEFTVEPIMDFFYKNYQIIHGIYSLILNVVLKIIDLITGPAS